MRAVRQRNTTVEMQLRSALHRLGLRFRLHRRIIPGRTRTVDIVLPRARVVVFVDGCFWHSCPKHKTMPKANREWWRAKLRANTQRDRQSDRLLQDLGWRVVRVWEHENPADAAQRVLSSVSAALGGKDGLPLGINPRQVRIKTVQQDWVNVQRACA
jgi:DNA mismatch endonuclease, patch repair protein